VTWLWIIGGIVAVIAAISFVQYRAQAGTYVPLSQRQPTRAPAPEKELGMEATDVEAVARVTRQNESLDRGQTTLTSKRGLFGARVYDTVITPMADDETYAARYHTAYIKKKSKDTQND